MWQVDFVRVDLVAIDLVRIDLVKGSRLKVTDSVSPIQHPSPKKTIVQKCIKGGDSTPFQLDEVYKNLY